MANLEIYFSSPECDIFYNKNLNIVQTFWKGVYVSDEPFRKILDQIINVLEEKGASIIIADASDMFVISTENQEWILKNWYPRAIKAGFRYQGLILSKDTFSELTVKKISEKYDSATVTTQYFSTPTEALEWVKEIQSESEV